MTDTEAERYVYAGVTRWTGGSARDARPDVLGDVFRMKVGEYKWQHMADGFPEVVHVHCLTAHPDDPAVILVGTQDGPYRSTDRGETWQRLDFEPRDIQVWSIAFHPDDPNIVFAGTSPLGIYRSADGGDSWTLVAGSEAADRIDTKKFVNRVMRLAFEPGQPDTIYAAMEVNGAMRSLDGGKTWEDCNDALMRYGDREEYHSKVLTDDLHEGILDAHAICATPARPNAPIIALRLGLFSGNDNGKDWEDMKVGRFSPLTYARDICVSPQDSNVLYACLSVSSRGDTGSLCRSDDAGETWRRFDHSVSPEGTAMAVALDKTDPDTVFFTTRVGQVFGTEDGGKTWNSNDLPDGCDGVFALLCA
jgi:hypothetical protein